MTNTIETIVSTLLIPILPALAVLLGLLIRQQTERIKAELKLTEDSQVALRINEATLAVTDAILHTAQTYVAAMKDRNAFDAVAQQEAVRRSLDRAKLLMSDAVQHTVADVSGDLDAWIKTMIEAKIRELQLELPQGLPAVPVVPVTLSEEGPHI